MSPDAAARLTLVLYAVVAGAVVAVQIARSGVGPTVWVLYLIERAYVGLWLHGRANRRCPFPETGGALIIANHRSPVDPMLIWMNNHLGPRGPRPIRIISFLMAREFYEKPGIHWMCRQLRTIPVNRDGRDTAPAKDALKLLKSGHLVCVFPEGGINEGHGLLPFDPGVAWLAMRANVPVYPLFIHDAPVGPNMIAPFLRPCRVRVTYGDPIDLSPWRASRGRQALEQATDHLRQRMAELGGIDLAKEVIAPLPSASEERQSG